MSVTVQKLVKVNNVATDVTTFTIGVIRADTGETVVSSGTAMTHDATGQYSYTFTEPAAGLTYTITYVLTRGTTTKTWSESVVGSIETEVPMPTLTGDNLYDTLQSLIVERLWVARAGPKMTYRIGNQSFNWTQYLQNLDERIDHLRAQYAQENPVEDVGVCL